MSTPDLSPADRAASAAWHAEQSAALYDEAAADARKADDETEAALCEAYAAGVRAESRRRAVADCRADYAAAQASRVWQSHRDDADVRR